MDSDRNLLERCKPLFVKLTRISNSEINRWKQGMIHTDRSYLRRRSRSISQEAAFKKLNTKKSKKRTTKYSLSDNDGGLRQSQIFSSHDDVMIPNEGRDVDKANSSVHERRYESIDDIMLPKNSVPMTDKFAWKYKRKRRKISQSFDRKSDTCDNNDKTKNITELSRAKQTDDHETASLNLNKEVKIVSSRLEDSDDPQVEKWRSKKKTWLSLKSKQRLPPKSNTLDCTVCSVIFDNKEELSDHIFKHTQRELQEAYEAAKTKLRGGESNGDIGNNSGSVDADVPSSNVTLSRYNQLPDMESQRKRSPQVIPIAPLSTDVMTKESSSVPTIICSCHTEPHPQDDPSVQIEMVLFCETCHVLFRRSECFETHYRFSSICNTDRTKGRTPKLFCSTCRVIFNTLSNMRQHLEEHASINFHRTVTFVCNICRVVFFGVGTVFCTHWFNHEKDPTFVASRYSFPKLCVSTQGTKPSGGAPDEQYFFVAEYVCRTCKIQFSSECELAQHTTKDCKGPTTAKGHVQSKTTQSNTIMANSASTKSNSEMDVSKNVPVSLKSLDMINKWICEFCGESYPTRDAFEEHSSKHLQDDGYPGYSCVLQSTASTAYICNVCRNVFTTLHDLMKHWVTHDVIKFICTECNERCSSYNSFDKHIALRCWKSKPDCRVWFNRQHSCKICKCVYKTAEELAHHYAFEHVTERNTIPILPMDSSRSTTETAPTSGTLTTPQLEKNYSAQRTIVKSSDSTGDQTAPVNYALQNSSLTNFHQILAANVENSITQDKSKQGISTIKITIPNLLEKPTILCQPGSISDPVSSTNNIQENTSEICKLPNESASNNISSTVNKEHIAPESSMITEATTSEPRNTCETTVNVGKESTCVPRTSVILKTSATLLTGNDNSELKNAGIRDSLSHQPMTKDLQHPVSSISLTSACKSPRLGDQSKLNDTNDELPIIIKSKNSENLSIMSEKESEMSKCDEPEIVEINENLTVTPKTCVENPTSHETKTLPSKDSELECQLESQRSPAKNQSLCQETSNNQNKNETVIKFPNKINACSIDTEGSKPRGFLRVKKFTELQAIRNYICHLCAAAFDNVMSLDEHVIAHERRPVENEKHPRMMAALILPQAESNTALREPLLPTTLPVITQITGNRTLPHIPQYVVNMNGRKAASARGQVNNKSHHLSDTHTAANTRNSIQEQSLYTCPLCLQCFRCEDFANHLATNHSMSLSDININSDTSTVPQKTTNTLSKKEQEVYNRKIGKFTTLDRGTIDEHVGFHHVNGIQPNINIAPTRNLASSQHNILTVSANGRMNPNIIPPFKCSLCTNYQYNTIKELSQHVQTVHYSIVRKGVCHPFVCNICYLPFQTYDELIVHTNSHQNTRWT